MAMTFTPNQQKAIETRDQTILVSASAGSGKTRVLVQRVLERLLAGDDIDRFLIVTFTEAAAAEMKERLEKAIRSALHENQVDRQHLLRQLRLLNVANISTLHAFALRLIEQYHYAIDLDPQFRLLADTAESTLLRLEVYDQLLEEAYAHDTDGSFREFVTQFMVGGQDDQPLREAVFSLFDFAMARPDTDDWLEHLVDNYIVVDDFAQSDYYKDKIKPTLVMHIQAARDLIEQAIHEAQVSEDSKAVVKRFATLEADAKIYDSLLQAVTGETSFEQLYKVMTGVEFEKWGAGSRFTKNDDPELKIAWDEIKEQRDSAKEHVDGILQQYFILDQEGLTYTMSGAKQVLANLVAFTQHFAAAFLQEKLQRKVLDFNDLEHFALKIVSQDDIAVELRQHYLEIMVDEYQDTNQLQEAILQSFARENNVFQVGDIKQSIYKFRQADPSLFQNKLSNYPDQKQAEVITLQENFRSQPNVTNFINYLFTQLMSNDLGDIDYKDEHKLVAGATYYPESLPKKAELLIYLNDQAEDDVELEPLKEQSNSYTKTTGQITMMALKIQHMMQDGFKIYDRDAQVERALRYRDITILVPTRGQNLDVIDVFKRLNIPVTVQGAENYFQTTEISVMMSLLQVIDNPHQDIPLAAVLRSPLYGLGENALALIRAQKMDGDFWEALDVFRDEEQILIATEGIDDNLVAHTIETIKRFETELATFRQLAVQNQIVDLLWQIYYVTGWLDYVGGLPSGSQRQANLHALYERAASYQKSSFVGLYQFINYVLQLQAQDKDLGEADTHDTTDAVQLMTIHHSKGLEFPVVFMLNTTRTMISSMDTTGKLLLDAQAGAGLDYVDMANHLKLPTIQRSVVQDAIRRSSFAEALRQLYVAMTRAEQHIFMVGTYQTVDRLWAKWSLAAHTTTRMLPEWIRLEGKSFMDLAGMALVRHPDFKNRLNLTAEAVDLTVETTLAAENEFDFEVSVADNQKLLADEQALVAPNLATLTTKQTNQIGGVPTALLQQWKQTLQFDYAYDSATRATNYQSVSEIKRLFEDPDLITGRTQPDIKIEGDVLNGLRFTDDDLPDPDFMQDGATRVSSATIGTATHLLLQRLDLSAGIPDRVAIKTLRDQLVADGLIEADVAPLIRIPKIEHFFTATTLGKQMVAHADTLKREQAFSLLVDAKMLYRDFIGDERVLVHGILDGYFTVGDELWLFDYKTDFIESTQDVAQVLTDRYAGQLNIYAQALVAQGLPYPRRFIYSFGAEKVIEL